GVLEAVAIFGFFGTLVVRIVDAVHVAIAQWAAAQLGVRRVGSGLARTSVGHVGNTVVIVIGVETAIFVLEFVDVFFFGRALVGVVTHAVVVVVEIGAT